MGAGFRRRLQSRALRLGLIVLAPLLVGAAVWKATEETPDGIDAFVSGGKTISVERFESAGTGGRRPAIVMLHGIDGAFVYGRHYRAFARALADEGYVVFYVHYFDGMGYENLLDLPSETLNDTCFAQRDEWIATVGDAVRFVAKRSDVDPDRIGLLGFSLGGYVSLSVTERAIDDASLPRPAAVVEYFGGLFEDRKRRPVVAVDGFPPVQILHGALDRRVPIGKAHELDRLLIAAGVPHELHVYPDRGHGILGEDAPLKTVEFFERYLKAAGMTRRLASAR